MVATAHGATGELVTRLAEEVTAAEQGNAPTLHHHAVARCAMVVPLKLKNATGKHAQVNFSIRCMDWSTYSPKILGAHNNETQTEQC